MAKRIAVIGGGISGLCVAYGLRKKGHDVLLLEKSGGVGGNIRSEQRDGYLFEHGPNSTLTSRELLDLVDDLGITDKIEWPSPLAKKRFIVRDSQLTALPSGPLGLLSTNAFSGSSKLALLKEPFRRSQGKPDESAAEFFERRLGREIVDYAVDPFISGIYAGDPDKLSVEFAFPRLFELERDFGSIVKGAFRSPKPAASKLPKGTPRSLTFKNGMQTLVNELEKRIGTAARKDCGELQIRKTDGQIEITTAGNRELFDVVAICTPAYAAADLIGHLDSYLASELAGIYYPPVSVVYTGFSDGDVGVRPDGFGFLVPGIEKRRILGCLWTSSVFDGRAPKGYHLFTTFIGGSRNAEFGHSGEDDLAAIALDELRVLMKVSGTPVFTAVKKWARAIPQYNIGYRSAVEAIENFRRAIPQIFLCGNYYKGISVSDCVKNGAATAREISEFLTSGQKK